MPRRDKSGLPYVIEHRHIPQIQRRLDAEPYFQPGPQTASRPAWVDEPVVQRWHTIHSAPV